MKSLIECAKCGKKPRVKPNKERAAWDGEQPQQSHETDPSGMGLREETKAKAKPSQAPAPVQSRAQPRSQLSVARAQAQTQAQTQAQPQAQATKKSSSVFDRLTDTSKYSGTHKARFDAQGRGLGLAGRDSVSKGAGHLPPPSMSNVKHSNMTTPTPIAEIKRGTPQNATRATLAVAPAADEKEEVSPSGEATHEEATHEEATHEEASRDHSHSQEEASGDHSHSDETAAAEDR